MAAGETPETATARRFAAIKNNPSLLVAFLREMPKGGDLHNHLSGAVYAESYLRWAAEDKLCLATATMAIVSGSCDANAGQPPVTAVLQNGALVIYGMCTGHVTNSGGRVEISGMVVGNVEKKGGTTTVLPTARVGMEP